MKGRFLDSDSGVEIKGITHSGIHNFTLGKRISNISYANCEGLFVSGLDFETQTVYVVCIYFFYSLFSAECYSAVVPIILFYMLKNLSFLNQFGFEGIINILVKLKK